MDRLEFLATFHGLPGFARAAVVRAAWRKYPELAEWRRAKRMPTVAQVASLTDADLLGTPGVGTRSLGHVRAWLVAHASHADLALPWWVAEE